MDRNPRPRRRRNTAPAGRWPASAACWRCRGRAGASRWGCRLPCWPWRRPIADHSMSVPIAADAPERYVVKNGDTLWDISAVFLRDPWYWPEIWYVNPAIANPHLIYPGDVLHLVYVDGKPRVTIERARRRALSPQVRSQPLDGAIRAIPYDLLMNFVGRPHAAEQGRGQGRALRRRHPRPAHRRLRARTRSTAAAWSKPATGSRYTIVARRRGAARSGRRRPARLHRRTYAGTGGHPGDKRRGARQGLDRHEREDDLRSVVGLGPRDPAGRQAASRPQTTSARTSCQARRPRRISTGQVIAVARRRVRRGQLPGARAQPRQEARARARQRRRHFLARRGGPRSLRPAGPGAAMATNYEKVRLPDERSATLLVFTGVRPHELRAGRVESTHRRSRCGDYIEHPNFGHRDTGLTATTCALIAPERATTAPGQRDSRESLPGATPGRLFAVWTTRIRGSRSRAPPACTPGMLPAGPLRDDCRTAFSRGIRATHRGARAAARGDRCAAPTGAGRLLVADERWLAGSHRRIVGYGTPSYPRCSRRSPTRRSCSSCEGDAGAARPAAARDGRRPQPDRDRPRHGAPVRRAPRARRARDHERARARHRRGEPSGRARGRGSHDRGAGLRPRPRSIPREHAALAREIAAARARSSREFPTGVRHRCRSTFRGATASSAGSSLGTLVVEAALAERLADHRPARRRAGSRGVRHPRLDPQPAVARLSPADPPGRKARRERGRHIRRNSRPSRWSRSTRRLGPKPPDGQADYGPRVGQGV